MEHHHALKLNHHVNVYNSSTSMCHGALNFPLCKVQETPFESSHAAVQSDQVAPRAGHVQSHGATQMRVSIVMVVPQ